MLSPKHAKLVSVAIASNTGWSKDAIGKMATTEALDYLEAIKELNKPEE